MLRRTMPNAPHHVRFPDLALPRQQRVRHDTPVAPPIRRSDDRPPPRFRQRLSLRRRQVLTFDPSIYGNGRFVAFASSSDSLVLGDANGQSDVFVKDLSTGAVTLASASAGGGSGNGSSRTPSLSADGRLVAFQSDASSLVPGDTNGTWDVFVRDLGGAGDLAFA